MQGVLQPRAVVTGLGEQPFFHLHTTGFSHGVSAGLGSFLFNQDRVNEVADSVSRDHSTSHWSMLLALRSSGFLLAIYFVTAHVSGLWSAPLFFLH